MPSRTLSKSFSCWVRLSSFCGLWWFFFLFSFSWAFLLAPFVFVSEALADVLAAALLLSEGCVLCSCWLANAVLAYIVAYTHITAKLIINLFMTRSPL